MFRPYEEKHGRDAAEAVGHEAGEDDSDQEAEEGRLLSQLPDGLWKVIHILWSRSNRDNIIWIWMAGIQTAEITSLEQFGH